MRYVNRMLIAGIIVVSLFTVKITFFNNHPRVSPAVNSSSSAEPAGDFKRFLAALADKESGGDPNAVCPDGCCVGLYQITEIYVDDLREIYPDLNFTYEERLDSGAAGQFVALYLMHYVANRLVDYDWSTLARVHHGGPDGWDEEYTRGFGEDVVRRMRTTNGH